MTKIAGSASASGSGSISQRYGSADPDPDPDPHQNFMDPQHWIQVIIGTKGRAQESTIKTKKEGKLQERSIRREETSRKKACKEEEHRWY